MSTDKTRKVYRLDRGLVGIILAIILAAVLSAGISVALATSIQDKYNSERAQQVQQSSVIFGKLCNTLDSLHADIPPKGTGPNSVYLQDLHNRLGDLASDIKC
jgi:hypothetical protein